MENKLEKIKNLTRKNPTIQKVFLNIAKDDDSDFEIIKDIYNEIIKYSNLLKNKNFSIMNYNEKTFENIFDDISTLIENNEKRKYALSFVSKKYQYLFDEETYNIFYEIKKMNLSHEKVNELAVAKIARYKNVSEFNDSLWGFIESQKNNNIEEIKNKINNKNLNVDIIYENHEKNEILVEINDYEASKALGSKSWCISTRKSYFDSYKGVKNFLENRQFFLWDFDKKMTDNRSQIGFTLDPNLKLLNAHLKNDRSMNFKELYVSKMDVISKITPYDDNKYIQIINKKKLPEKFKLRHYIKVLNGKLEEKIFDVLKKEKINASEFKNWFTLSSGRGENNKIILSILEKAFLDGLNDKESLLYTNVKTAILSLILYDGRKTNQGIDLLEAWNLDNFKKLSKEKWFNKFEKTIKASQFSNVFNFDFKKSFEDLMNDSELKNFFTEEIKNCLFYSLINKKEDLLYDLDFQEKIFNYKKDFLHSKDIIKKLFLSMNFNEFDNLLNRTMADKNKIKSYIQRDLLSFQKKWGEILEDKNNLKVLNQYGDFKEKVDFEITDKNILNIKLLDENNLLNFNTFYKENTKVLRELIKNNDSKTFELWINLLKKNNKNIKVDKIMINNLLNKGVKDNEIIGSIFKEYFNSQTFVNFLSKIKDIDNESEKNLYFSYLENDYLKRNHEDKIIILEKALKMSDRILSDKYVNFLIDNFDIENYIKNNGVDKKISNIFKTNKGFSFFSKLKDETLFVVLRDVFKSDDSYPAIDFLINKIENNNKLKKETKNEFRRLS